MSERTLVRSYSTDFSTDENPVDEDGMWLNGKKDGIDWTDCIVSNGFVHGAPSRMNVLEKRSEQGNLGDQEEARHWYDQAVQWMNQKKPRDQELHRLRAEAATLLGIEEEPPNK